MLGTSILPARMIAAEGRDVRTVCGACGESACECAGRETEAAPPGWSGTVRAMKGEKDIDNPFALAWSMRNKGATPHYAPESEGEPPVAGSPVRADLFRLVRAQVAQGLRPVRASMSGAPTSHPVDTLTLKAEGDGETSSSLSDAPVAAFQDDLARKERLHAVMHGPEGEEGPGVGEARYTKEQADYGHASDSERSCGTCEHFQPGNACDLVMGAIREIDTCKFWRARESAAVAPGEGHAGAVRAVMA